MYYFGTSVTRFVLITFTTVIFSSIAIGQEYIDLFKASHSISPSNPFEDSECESMINETKIDLTLPVKLNDRIALLTGVAYDRISVTVNPGRQESTVTGVALKMGANVKHSSKWSGTYLVLPKVASDLKELSQNDLQIGGAVLMKYTKSKRFNYKFGVYSNREHFGTIIAPIVGFYYLDRTERFEANVLVPSLVDLNYKVSKRVKTGVNFNGQVKTYNLNGTSLDQGNYLSRTSNELTAYVEYEIKNGFHFQVAVGHSFARSYRVYDEGVSLALPLVYFGDERKQLNADFSDGFLFKVGVSYRLNLSALNRTKDYHNNL